jgi:hypothetical protein
MFNFRNNSNFIWTNVQQFSCCPRTAYRYTTLLLTFLLSLESSSSLSRVARQRSGWPGLDSWQEQELSLHHGATGCGAHSAFYPVGIARTPSRGVKHPRHEADYRPPCGGDVKNAWSYTSITSAFSWRGV